MKPVLHMEEGKPVEVSLQVRFDFKFQFINLQSFSFFAQINVHALECILSNATIKSAGL